MVENNTHILEFYLILMHFSQVRDNFFHEKFLKNQEEMFDQEMTEYFVLEKKFQLQEVYIHA